MFCRNCGTDVTGMKYCPKCGVCVENERKVQSVKDIQSKKKLTISQIKWLSFSVVFTAWSLLVIISTLFPSIMCEIMYDYSGYDRLQYIYMGSYFVLTVFFGIKMHRLIKSSGYIETPQYKLSETLALNKSNFLQMIILAFFIWYAMISKRPITQGNLWSLSICLIIVNGIVWIRWFLVFKAVRAEDIKVMITVFYISFREFWISLLLFLILDALLAVTASTVFVGVIVVVLIFTYPAIQFIRTKRVLEQVYKIK